VRLQAAQALSNTLNPDPSDTAQIQNVRVAAEEHLSIGRDGCRRTTARSASAPSRAKTS